MGCNTVEQSRRTLNGKILIKIGNDTVEIK